MNPLTALYGLLTGSKFIWKIVRNWSVLSKSFQGVTDILSNMNAEGRSLPNTEETQMLLNAVSNIVKTEIIDIPGLDEYSLAVNLDHFSSSLGISIQDSKNGKFHTIKVKKSKAVPKKLEEKTDV